MTVLAKIFLKPSRACLSGCLGVTLELSSEALVKAWLSSVGAGAAGGFLKMPRALCFGATSFGSLKLVSRFGLCVVRALTWFSTGLEALPSGAGDADTHFLADLLAARCFAALAPIIW